MSDQSQSTPSNSEPSIGEALTRFGDWCKSNPVHALLLGGILGCFLWFFCGYPVAFRGTHSVMGWAAGTWGVENDLEHGWLIFPGAVVVAWLHFKQFAEAEKRPSWLGLLPLAFGILLYLVGVWTKQTRIDVAALPVLLAGTIWCLWGWRVTRIALFPLTLLLFMIPLGFILSRTEPLQHLVASVVTAVSNLVGVGVERDGVKLLARDGSFQCEVAGGCSGIRSIMAMTLLSFIYVHFNFKEPWKKLLTLGMTIPFAVVGNIFRVFTIVLASKWFGQGVGAGPWHDVSGFVITIPIAVGAMILFGDLLNRDWSSAKDVLLKKDIDDAPSVPSQTTDAAPESTRQSSGPISYDY